MSWGPGDLLAGMGVTPWSKVTPLSLSPRGKEEGLPRVPSLQLHDISEPRATMTSRGPGDLLAGVGVTPGVPIPLLTVEPNHCFQD